MSHAEASESSNGFGRPLNVTFVITSMPIGGAEKLLVSLVRHFDRGRIVPGVVCLKEKGVLGEELAREIRVDDNLIRHKFDFLVTRRLKRLFMERRTDAMITVGAGDKMFWGRLAARHAGVPVILSALHSTGWPDGVGRLNRLLTPITDGFIACADSHGQFLKDFERFPPEKVFVIPNGIDTDAFSFDPASRNRWREQLGISEAAPVAGIVAALRPEKNHSLFLQTAARVLQTIPHAEFAIAGDGPARESLQALASTLGIRQKVHFVGSTSDVSGFLSALDLFALTSLNEAKPVSILEALSCERPVVATDVGSVRESVLESETGYVVKIEDEDLLASRWVELLSQPGLRQQFGTAGRRHVQQHSSLASMTEGYMQLVERLFRSKRGATRNGIFAGGLPLPSPAEGNHVG